MHTAFTICCSCSDMPALGFIAAGIAPGTPGKAMSEAYRECGLKKRDGGGRGRRRMLSTCAR